MLTPAQKRQASAYGPRFPIATIAREIGAPFEEVAIWVYGGEDYTLPTPRKERTNAASGPDRGGGVDGGDAGRSGGDRPGAGEADPTPAADHSPAAPAGVDATEEETAPEAAAEAEPGAAPPPSLEEESDADLRNELRVPAAESVEGHEPARTQEDPPGPGGEGAAGSLPAAIEPAALYRLTNGAGEYLHRSGVGMTRDLEKAWSGTPAQLHEVRSRKRNLDALEQEPVR